MSDQEEAGGIKGFRVGFGEASEAEAAPAGSFRILVVGGFAARAELATTPRPTGAGDPIAIAAATFDEVMAQLDSPFEIEVPNPASQGKPLPIRLSFPRLRSFRPDVLVQEVEAFRALRRDDPPPPSPAQATPAPAPTAGGKSLIDDILAGMASVPAASAVTSAPIAQAHANGAREAALLGSILGHPEVRRLERAWRGLKLLVERAVRGGVTVAVVSAEIDEVEGALARAAAPSDAGTTDLFVVDYEVGPSARDLERAERWSLRAEAIPAPLVTNASPEVLGFDDLEQLARTHRRVRSVEDPRAVAFRALTEKDATRWLLLAMNGALLRPAHSPETTRLRDVAFEESAPLDGGAAWLVAIAVARAFQDRGWGCALTEPKYRTTSDLSVHLVDDRGGQVSIATRAFVSTEVAGEAAAGGVAVVTAVRDRDAAVLPFAPMVYRGPVGREGVRGAAELTLGDQLFVARMVPLITELAATIPRDTDAAAARDTARIALLSLFARPDVAPAVDARVVGGTVLEITLRPKGFEGLGLPEITLSAPLG
jgi:type VI secretion system protein ImpC